MGFINQARNGINKVNGIPAFCKPKGIRSSRAADVEHDTRRRWYVTLDQLAGADGLQEKCPLFETTLFGCLSVVVRNGGID